MKTKSITIFSFNWGTILIIAIILVVAIIIDENKTPKLNELRGGRIVEVQERNLGSILLDYSIKVRLKGELYRVKVTKYEAYNIYFVGDTIK